MLEGISLLGFDNIFWSNYTNHQLSTIKMPKKEFQKTLKNLFRINRKKGGEKSIKIVKHRLLKGR